MQIYIFIFAVTKWINNVNEFNNSRGDFVILQYKKKTRGGCIWKNVKIYQL